jgi:hypothetical protein
MRSLIVSVNPSNNQSIVRHNRAAEEPANPSSRVEGPPAKRRRIDLSKRVALSTVPCTIDSLPSPVVAHIGSFVPVPDVKIMMLVCKKFRDDINSDFFVDQWSHLKDNAVLQALYSDEPFWNDEKTTAKNKIVLLQKKVEEMCDLYGFQKCRILDREKFGELARIIFNASHTSLFKCTDLTIIIGNDQFCWRGQGILKNNGAKEEDLELRRLEECLLKGAAVQEEGERLLAKEAYSQLACIVTEFLMLSCQLQKREEYLSIEDFFNSYKDGIEEAMNERGVVKEKKDLAIVALDTIIKQKLAVLKGFVEREDVRLDSEEYLAAENDATISPEEVRGALEAAGILEPYPTMEQHEKKLGTTEFMVRHNMHTAGQMDDLCQKIRVWFERASKDPRVSFSGWEAR